MEIVVFLGVIVAFFWSLVTLRDLKDGQAEMLQRLKRIEDALETQSQAVNSTGDR